MHAGLRRAWTGLRRDAPGCLPEKEGTPFAQERRAKHDLVVAA